MNIAQHSHSLLDSNIQVMAQLTDMLQMIDAPLYAHQINSKNSTIGAHTRHIIEFYQEFMPVLADASLTDLCYDNRKRELALEHSKDSATEALEAISTSLVETNFANRSITLACIAQPDAPLSKMETNLERELMFLLDHSIHHMAIIKMLAENSDISFDESFGVAGATLVYQKKTA